MIAEIRKSSVAYDLHQKFDLYQEASVQEYLAVLLFEKEIRWHVFVDGVYQILPADKDGIWRSRVFPGLWLDGAAFLQGDMKQVLTKLQEGLASLQHAQFIGELAARQR